MKIYLCGALGTWAEDTIPYLYGAFEKLDDAIKYMTQIYFLPENDLREIFTIEMELGKPLPRHNPITFLSSYKHYKLVQDNGKIYVKSFNGMKINI